MKFGSNLGLVRTLNWASLKKIVRSVFEISKFEIADPIPIWAVWAIFKLAVRIAQSFETNEIWVKLRTGQDLETGQV